MKLRKFPPWVVFLIYSILVYAYLSSFAPFLNVYFTNIGMKPVQIGFIAGFTTIVAMASQPLWGALSDKLHNRRLILLIVLACVALIILLYPLNKTFAYLMLMTLLFYAFSASILPLGDAITLHNLNRMGVNFSAVRIGGTLGYAFCVVLFGQLYIKHSNLMFYIASFMVAITLIPVFLFPKEQSLQSKAAKKSSVEHKSSSLDLPLLKNYKVLLCVFMMFFSQVALSYYWNFMPVAVAQMHYGNNVIGYLQFTSAMSEVPMLLNINKLKARFGTFRLLLFASFMISVRIIIGASSGDVYTFFIAQLLQSCTGIVMYYCCITYISTHVGEHQKSRGQIIYAVVLGGFACLIGNMGGGALSQAIGIRYGFFLAGSIALLSTIVFGVIVYRQMRSGKIDRLE